MFTIFVSVDGQWAGWLQWSGCSVTCSRSLFQLTVNGPDGCSGLVCSVTCSRSVSVDHQLKRMVSGSSVTCSRSLFQLTVNGPDGCSGLAVV